MGMLLLNVLAQIGVDPVAIPTLTENVSLGGIVGFVLWYLYNENQKTKAEWKEKVVKVESERDDIRDKYDALIKECHQKEIDLIARRNHRNDN